jgi:hypothetical protein
VQACTMAVDDYHFRQHGEIGVHSYVGSVLEDTCAFVCTTAVPFG